MHLVRYPSVLDVLVLVFFRAISRRLPGGCLASTRYLVGCLSGGPVLNVSLFGRFPGLVSLLVLFWVSGSHVWLGVHDLACIAARAGQELGIVHRVRYPSVLDVKKRL